MIADVVRPPQESSLHHAGGCLERVASRSGEMRLLSTSATTEVVEIVLHAGKRLSLVPTRGAVETYYVLSGELRSAEGKALRPGDHIFVQPHDATETFMSLSETRLLFVSSVPQFGDLSQELRTLQRLASEVEQKDGYTSEHCGRIRNLSYATGVQLGLSAEHLLRLNDGAYFHDVGKTKIPETILNKPGKLTPEEWRIMKKHPQFGRETLEPTPFSAASVIVEQHHERLDGSGYPYGLAGDEILTEAYIVAVADTFDAMTTDRPYRRALPAEIAFAEIRQYAGIHFPTYVTEAFFSAVTRLAVSGSGA